MNRNTRFAGTPAYYQGRSIAVWQRALQSRSRPRTDVRLGGTDPKGDK